MNVTTYLRRTRMGRLHEQVLKEIAHNVNSFLNCSLALRQLSLTVTWGTICDYEWLVFFKRKH